jgi:putative aminotransferase
MNYKNYKNYKICNRCVMDTTDSKIQFDRDGRCDHCQNFKTNIAPNWHTGEQGLFELEKVAKKIKNEGIGKDFDCIIGLSGGLDSSYTAYVAKEVMGLRPLLFHVDAGWNTDQAVGNIEKLVDGLGVELYTEVINWKEMQDLQVAFFKSQTPDQDIPQDTAFFSALYKFARQNKIEYVLTGGNYSTECCREPDEWGAFPGIDKTLIGDIHKKFGLRELKTFPIIDALVYKIFYHKILGMKIFKPLDLVPFIKKDAETLLNEKYGWKSFQHKHHESRFTRFYEDYWLPRKFGYEKRRAHFSSLIMTGQMTRNEAIERLKTPEMDDKFMESEFEFVANKLGLSVAELQEMFDGKNKSFHDYKNKYKIFNLGGKLLNLLGLERRQYR